MVNIDHPDGCRELEAGVGTRAGPRHRPANRTPPFLPGSLVLEGGRLWRPARRHTVQVVDPIGAGDAFVAGFLWATLGGRGPQAAVDAGTAVAALKCSTWGDIALIDAPDVEDLLAGGPDVRR